MRAVTLAPGRRDSLALQQVPEPSEAEGSVLVRSLAIGICGTDRELIEGGRDETPPGSDRLILGHESLGSVIDGPPASGFAAGERGIRHANGFAQWQAAYARHPDDVKTVLLLED